VSVRPGDAVRKGGELASLNRSELLLEQSSAQAEVTRNLREAEKARAAKALGEMRIAEAVAEQARARLDLVNYRLEHAVVKSPFDGAIVEGDLRERIGAPIKQGETLYKIARLDTLYVEADVDESDIREISAGSVAEIAFVAQPRLKFPAVVQVIEPAAVPKKDGNVFLVRLRPEKGVTAWWRPGMTGVCKITAGKRTLFWILTHRTADFLRLKLWW
jgi:multidrug resistance efflux pump